MSNGVGNSFRKGNCTYGAGSSDPGGMRQKIAPRALSEETFSVIREGSILVAESCRSSRDLSDAVLLSDEVPTYNQTHNCEPTFDVSDSRILSSIASSIVYVELLIVPRCTGPGSGPVIERGSKAVVGHPEGSPTTVTVARNFETLM